jgi:hypothetical protein
VLGPTETQVALPFEVVTAPLPASSLVQIPADDTIVSPVVSRIVDSQFQSIVAPSVFSQLEQPTVAPVSVETDHAVVQPIVLEPNSEL